MRRKYTVEELYALPVGTIFTIHHEDPRSSYAEDSEVWKVFGIGEAMLLSHGHDSQSDLKPFAGYDITVEGFDQNLIPHGRGEKLRIYINRKLDITPNKRAAHAVHAALHAFGVHPGVKVIVLDKGPTEIEKMRVVIHDAGHTELEPGTLTAGTNWPEDSEP